MSEISPDYKVDLRASSANPIYGASQTVMPPSVNLPIALYLGNTVLDFRKEGVGHEAGNWQPDAIREIVGSAGIGGQVGVSYELAMHGNRGALGPKNEKGVHSYPTNITNNDSYGGLTFSASRVSRLPRKTALPTSLCLSS